MGIDDLVSEVMQDVRRTIEETLRSEVKSMGIELSGVLLKAIREEWLQGCGASSASCGPGASSVDEEICVTHLPQIALARASAHCDDIPSKPVSSTSLTPTWARQPTSTPLSVQEGMCTDWSQGSKRDDGDEATSPSKTTPPDFSTILPGSPERGDRASPEDPAVWAHLMTSGPEGGRGEPPVRRGSVHSEESRMSSLSDGRWKAYARLQQIVGSTYFDFAVCSAILLNAVIITVQAEVVRSHVQRTHTLDQPFFFDVAERIFCTFFAFELILRIVCHRGAFFTMPDWRWNVFDLVVVVLQLLDVFTDIILGSQSTTNRLAGSFTVMRAFRVLRLIRIVRLVRVLRYFQDLRTMISSIAGSCRSLLWTIVLMVVMIDIVGVYLTNLIADHAVSNPAFLDRVDTRLYYGSLYLTTLSLFQATSGGVDWNTLLLPLSEEISPFMSVLFCLYIMFAVLCMMNVVTGIFVESALCTARADKDAELRRQIEQLFLRTDENKSGTISLRVFTSALQNPQVSKVLHAIDIDPSEAKGLFALLDTDGSGDIDSQEFVTGCLRLRAQARGIDLATLMYFNKRVSAWWVQRMGDVDDSLGVIEEALQDLLADKCGHGPSVAAAQPRSSIGGAHRSSSAQPVNFGATWADLKVEGDRRVTALMDRSNRRRGANRTSEAVAIAGEGLASSSTIRSGRSSALAARSGRNSGLTGRSSLFAQ